MTKLVSIKDEHEFHRTVDTIIQHLPNCLIGRFWNLIDEHRKLWESKQITFPKELHDQLKIRYKYCEDQLIEYRKEQMKQKKSKRFPFVFHDYRPKPEK